MEDLKLGKDLSPVQRKEAMKQRRKRQLDQSRTKCNICSKQCHSYATLKIYMRSHNGEKPYQCDVCKKSFSTTCNLNQHKLRHTGMKPYSCDVR